MQDRTTTVAAHGKCRALDIGRYFSIAALALARSALAQAPSPVEPGESPNAAVGVQLSRGSLLAASGVRIGMPLDASGQTTGLANVAQDLPGALQLAQRSQAYLAQLARGAARGEEQAADQRGKPGM